ncbi:hypothetical protein Val02_03380 [Virgisporangium aliadipatigenens]|uniref:HTH marR-type domain-containing protein n=1 Tax=Virgisporangium aliadipatigenens TaxID=741659 RepID=A0A8J4DNE9_9ACTN|nr:MarR family transcriptional regulator [Virgisporangium aliadipatigenens]GIJ43452.1 hypothetical protein Val02_03380 [Virgisporangium aliadipatigenens]
MSSRSPNQEARFAEASRLSQLLVAVAEEARAEFTSIVSGYGLPAHLARVLVLLAEPAPMRDLAVQLACDRSYITSLADQLERRGLLTRVPGADRRVKLLALTDEGVALRDKISGAVAERNLVMRRLTDEERRTLGPLLERLRGDGSAACDC